MFEKLKLKPYLLSIFSIVIVLSGILAWTGITGLLNANRDTNLLVSEILAADTAVKNCRIYVNIAARDLREMMWTDHVEDVQKFKDSISNSLTTVDEQVEIFKQTHGTEDGLAQKYESALDEWFNIANNAISSYAAGDIEGAKEIVLHECSPALSNLASISQEIDQITTDLRTEQENRTVARINIFMTITIVTFALILALSLFLSLRATNCITHAVHLIKDGVIKLSEGQLHTRIDYQSNNEFGELVERINFSFEELAKYVDAIDMGMSEFSNKNFAVSAPVKFIGDFAHIEESIESFQSHMNMVLTDLIHAADQVAAGAEQVSDGSQELAQGAAEQASSIEEISATFTEISTHISNTASLSQKADELGKETGEVVNNGREEMKQLQDSIHDIALASNNIQGIIKVIDDIAFQTNILALNAAVEAARAGNAGKGFAVVANEVRNLAKKSADAARDTTELIQNSLKHVSRGEEIAERTGAAFDNVEHATTSILDMIAQIAQASKEQADSVAQITVGVDQISAVIHTTSATSEESAATSEELNGQASLMKRLLNDFKLKGSASASSYTKPTPTQIPAAAQPALDSGFNASSGMDSTSSFGSSTSNFGSTPSLNSGFQNDYTSSFGTSFSSDKY